MAGIFRQGLEGRDSPEPGSGSLSSSIRGTPCCPSGPHSTPAPPSDEDTEEEGARVPAWGHLPPPPLLCCPVCSSGRRKEQLEVIKLKKRELCTAITLSKAPPIRYVSVIATPIPSPWLSHSL